MNDAEKKKENEQKSKTGAEVLSDKESVKEKLKRFDDLKQWYAEKQLNNEVKNMGDEGVERPHLADNVKPDTSNLFARPNMELLKDMGWSEESNAMATGTQMAKIEADVQALGVPKENMAWAMWAVARYCASASSSSKMDPQGSDGALVGNVSRDAIVATIKKHTTLRRVCRLYAPVIWQYMIVTDKPPEDWQAKQFRWEDRFAAFDFFDYVENAAAIQPLEGLLRHPTKEEKIANATHKRIKIDRDQTSGRYANLDTEITGGKFGCGVNRKWREGKCG